MSNYYRNAKPKHFRRAYPPSWNQHDRFDYGILFSGFLEKSLRNEIK